MQFEELPKLSLARRRDAQQLQKTAGQSGSESTAADLMRHVRTKEHDKDLDLGPSAWHPTKVSNHVSKGKKASLTHEGSVREQLYRMQAALHDSLVEKLAGKGQVSMPLDA